MTHVRVGLEVLRDRDFDVLSGKRVGLFTNPSAVDRTMQSAYQVFRAATNVNLVALYSPEHGFAAAAPDGEIIASNQDPKTGLPVHSLYGSTLHPTPEMFQNVDVIVCDIQDIGVRYYTYLWTITHLVEACGEQGIAVVILDRPNPLGDSVNGPRLDEAFSSLVGRYPVTVQHGMTLGEMVQMVNERWNPTPADLTVVRCEGWKRDEKWNSTGRVFVPPSPNMPHFVTVQHYPGACLVEGTNLSEGRGTSLPFEIVGAPFIDGEVLAKALNSQGHRGIYFRPHAFIPAASKFQGETCYGIQVHITDNAAFDALTVWLDVIVTVRNLYADDFMWREPFTESGFPPIDRLWGSDSLRHSIDAGQTSEALKARWNLDVEQFLVDRKPYLLY